jgi:hypothetical protein
LKQWIAKLYYMVHVTRTRMRSRLLVEQRAAEIEAGIELASGG